MAVRTMDRSVATPGGAVRSIRDGPPRPTSTARSYGRRHETGPDPPGPGRGLGSTASSISPSPRPVRVICPPRRQATLKKRKGQ